MANLISYNDSLRQGTDKLNIAIEQAERAEQKSDQAVSNVNQAIETASQALTKSENTQLQLDTIVIDGDSSVEAAQARVKADGTTYATLKERLDAGDSQLADIAVWVTPQMFGALGDGVHDDTDAFQAAINELREVGGTLYVSRGTYIISAEIYVNLDLCTSKDSGITVNIQGENAGTTVLINTSETDYILNIEQTLNTNTANLLHVENIQIKGSATNKGMRVHGCSAIIVERVYFYGMLTGMITEDCCRSRYIACEWNGNFNGLDLKNQVDQTTANAIDFIGCEFYGNAIQPLSVYGGCNINFIGGCIETSGFNRGGVDASGVKLYRCGRYGGACCTFVGTYFEGNSNKADVWIVVGTYPGTYNFLGCTFNKFASPLDNVNNIFVETGGTAVAHINVKGCSFQDRGNIPSSGTKYIQCNGPLLFLNEDDNQYENQLEMPSGGSKRVYATGKFVGLASTPSLWSGYNIKSIAKNGVGDYTITFFLPSRNVQKISIINCGSGFAEVITETETTLQFKTYNLSGELFDPSYLMMICSQA